MITKNKILIGSGLFLILIFLSKKKIKKTIKKIMLSLDQKKFIQSITDPAIKIGKAIGIPYKFIIAQICLETGYGKSSLSRLHNNYGGIKAKISEPHVVLMTTECDKNKVCKKVPQRFKIFPNAEVGINAQAVVYQNRYFKKYLNKTNDPIIYGKLLQSGPIKYATDPNYMDKIIPIINAI